MSTCLVNLRTVSVIDIWFCDEGSQKTVYTKFDISSSRFALEPNAVMLREAGTDVINLDLEDTHFPSGSVSPGARKELWKCIHPWSEGTDYQIALSPNRSYFPRLQREAPDDADADAIPATFAPKAGYATQSPSTTSQATPSLVLFSAGTVSGLLFCIDTTGGGPVRKVFVVIDPPAGSFQVDSLTFWREPAGNPAGQYVQEAAVVFTSVGGSSTVWSTDYNWVAEVGYEVRATIIENLNLTSAVEAAPADADPVPTLP